MNLTDALAQQANRTPDDLALDFAEGRTTYAQLSARVSGCVRYLFDMGIRPHQLIGLSFDDERMTLIATLAVTRIGATVYLVPRGLPSRQKSDMVRAVDLQLMLAEEKGDPDSEWQTHILSFKDLNPERDGLVPDLPVPPPDTLFMIVHGSGSTGNPKLLPTTHEQFTRICDHQKKRYGSQTGDAWASLLFLHYRTSLIHAVSAVTGGNTFNRRLNGLPVRQFLRECEDCRISFLYATPTHANGILAALPPGNEPVLPGLKGLILSFASVNPALRTEVKKRLTPKLFITYGSNEVGVMTILPPDAPESHTGSIGYPVEQNIIEIVDADENPLPPGTPGEIRVKNDQHFTGYIGDDAATSNAVRNGWFYPGDSGIFTEDGQLVHLGRSDHMMIYRGNNIYPAEIERVVAQVEGVTDVAVIPLPHPVRQDVPVCAFTHAEGIDLEALGLRRILNERLSFRAPEKLVALDTIPRNEQGKLDRVLLRKWIEDALNRAGSPIN